MGAIQFLISKSNLCTIVIINLWVHIIQEFQVKYTIFSLVYFCRSLLVKQLPGL